MSRGSSRRQPIHKPIHKAVHNSRDVLGRRRLELLVGENPFKASSSASFRVARRLANRLANRLPTLAAQWCRESAVAVARLQVRKVEDLKPEVLEVAVAVGLLDEPADLVVEALDGCV